MRTNQKRRPFVLVTTVLIFVLGLSTAGIPSPDAKAQAQSKAQSRTAVWSVENSSNQQNAPTTTLASPTDRSWTTAGSTGTIDEDTSAIAQLRNFTLSLKTGAVGTVVARYNITSTDGMNSFCPATNSTCTFRYRNSDASGTTANVTWEIHSSNILSGGDNVLVTFPGGFASGASFFTVNGFLAVGFDFSTNIYWLDVKVFRSDASQFADFGSFRLSESAGTACP